MYFAISWSTWSNFDSWDRETNANSLGFIGTTLQFELHSGVEFGHCLGLMAHPEVVDVFLAPLGSQPCLSEATEGVETHALFVHAHIAALENKVATLESRAPIPGPVGPIGPRGAPGNIDAAMHLAEETARKIVADALAELTEASRLQSISARLQAHSDQVNARLKSNDDSFRTSSTKWRRSSFACLRSMASSSLQIITFVEAAQRQEKSMTVEHGVCAKTDVVSSAQSATSQGLFHKKTRFQTWRPTELRCDEALIALRANARNVGQIFDANAEHPQRQ